MKPITILCAASALSVALLASSPVARAGGGVGTPPCVPIGDCASYLFCRPPLPPGMEWAGGNGDPVGYEDDAFSDDFLGPAGGSGDPASILVCNHSGELRSYPSFEHLNGPGELGQPEIFVRWTALYTTTVTTTTTQSSSFGATTTGGQGGASGSSTSVGSTSTVIRYRWLKSAAVEVVPC